MTISSRQAVPIGTTPTLIVSHTASTGAPANYLARNATGTATIYLGPAGVTTSTGFEWLSTDAPLSFALGVGEALYGVVASSTQNVDVLGQGT